MSYRNLGPYLLQRFPPIGMALFVILFLTVKRLAHVADATAFSFLWTDVLGLVAVISFFFRLRVFDEQKDYKDDLIHYPDRILQSGKITIRELRNIAIGGGILEITWSYLSGGTSCLLLWTLTFGYSLAMRYEFGISTWLKPRLVLYAFSHMLIMPLVIAWVWSGHTLITRDTGLLGLLMALSLTGGFAFELARKIHAPQAEKAGITTYSSLLGMGGSVAAVLGVLLTGTGILSLLFAQTQLPAWTQGLMWGFLAGTAAVYLWAVLKQAERSFRLGEILVSLFMLLSYSLLLILLP